MTKEIKNSEKSFLHSYDATAFNNPNVTVDTVIFTIHEDSLKVLLVQRAEYPCKDQWSLVGGFVDLNTDKSIEDTAKRKLEEKTGIKTPYLEQFYTIGNNKRDPRGWTVTTVYFALIPYCELKSHSPKNVNSAEWVRVTDGKVKENLAFDHKEILLKCTERLRSKVLYTSLPVFLTEKEFTLGQLQKIYEIILGRSIDRKAFRRRMLNASILEETKLREVKGIKPTQLYKVKKSKPHYFVRNIEGKNNKQT